LFRGDSYITCVEEDPNESDGDLVLQLKGAGLDIAGQLTGEPASNWFSAGVDFLFEPTPEADEREFEVIAPEMCPIWFTDLEEPRCVKFFRRLNLVSGANITLVDGHANYANHEEEEKALYFVYRGGHLFLDLPDSGENAIYVDADSTLTLNDNLIYYYGATDTDGTIDEPDQLIELSLTEYGDFAVDGTFDADDVAIWSDVSYMNGPAEPAPHPLADWDKDCDGDIVDYFEYQRRVPGNVSKFYVADGFEGCEFDTGGRDGGTRPPGGGGPAEEEPAPSQSWTYDEADLSIVVTPVGGGDPVTTLQPNTAYEVHYEADHEGVHGYLLFAISTSPDESTANAEPAEDGMWATTGNFRWFDLDEDLAGAVPAVGYPDGYYRYDLVWDETDAGPQGHICTVTTGSAGELNLNLHMWWIDELGMVMVNMEAKASFQVVGD
jgi:hypothetical protein